MLSPATQFLRDLVCARAAAAARAWLDAALAGALAGDREAVCAAYTRAPRHVGRELLRLSAGERTRLPGADARLDHWTTTDACRAMLLVAASEGPGESDCQPIAVECYERGDSGEQQSWLKSLPLLPRADRFVELAIDACRTNILPQFEAIACDNVYPARSFPEPSFNQLVLKALFLGVPLARIVGLETRLNAELSRMAVDFAAERRAAGREAPADLTLALTNELRTQEQFR